MPADKRQTRPAPGSCKGREGSSEGIVEEAAVGAKCQYLAEKQDKDSSRSCYRVTSRLVYKTEYDLAAESGMGLLELARGKKDINAIYLAAFLLGHWTEGQSSFPENSPSFHPLQ